jgi:hypothetical protein
MDAPPIRSVSALRADLVPHHEWASRRWFYANPIWYYHRQSTGHEIRTGHRFYDLVDPKLREVCRLLSRAGLGTTPSCQGHSYPRERFEQIWTELNREARAIHGDGLVVRDCESDAPYLFRQPDWHVPWSSFDTFYREAAAHQNEGYLGIIVPQNQPALEERFQREPYRTRWSILALERCPPAAVPGSLFGLRVNAIDESVRDREWEGFTHYIRALLESRSVSDRHADALQHCHLERQGQDVARA